MDLRHKMAGFIAVLLISGSMSCYAENDYVGILNSTTQNPTMFTTIEYDDTTGAILNTNSPSLLGIGGNNLLGAPSGISPAEIAELQAFEQQLHNGPIPDGYSSWNEFRNAIITMYMNGEIPDGFDSWDDYKQYLLDRANAANNNNINNNPGTVNYKQTPQYRRYQDALAVMPVAAQTAGYINQLNSYDEAFQNMDMHMMMPYKDRIAYRFANKYALEDSEHVPQIYSPTIIYSHVARTGGEKGIWLRPYTSFGSINYKNGPKVDNNMFGVYMGGDSSMIHLKHSDFQYSIYAGYNNSFQKYGSNTNVSNGGLMGITGTWYGEKAYAGLTINAGASNNELSTAFMRKDYPMFTAGAAFKTGYNFELADGKFIIQPNYLMSYSFVTPFEKGSIAGMEIQSKPLNVVNISPGIKFVGNLKHGWQPYIEGRVMWSLFDKSDYSTALIDVPSISLKPYAQYGIGIQKVWGERSTGFAQFMMRSGGRNDVSFNFGYKCALGE